ncbi:MAG TPA: MmgE/PrpD family protein [Vicinamibacterales bacterium]|nr:MmgE/PrpD family protein [Vicinamibacterales bacterium]
MTTDIPLATQVAEWVARVTYDDLPEDVIAATKLRILDVVGLSLAGAETPFGRSTRAAARALSPAGSSRLLGSGERVSTAMAAFANAACAQALEYDDTHNESIVHMSSPSVAAALALAEERPIAGRDAILAIAVGSEISCRAGSVAPGQFHRLGFHPTGLFAPFGVTYLAGRLLGLDAPAMAAAAGICGSLAAGLLECWADGTDAKFLHSGWAAHNGIAAARLARHGVTGPPRILEGRLGLFASHLQDPSVHRDLGRIVEGLGGEWVSRNSSFKPYPAAHVLHPYVDALLRARERHRIAPADVVSIECPVAAYVVPIVCEPVAEKVAPATQAHGRVSLQFTLAEALCRGRLGRRAYQDYRDPDVRALARRVTYRIDPEYPGPGRFKGAVRITLADGRVIEEVQEFNRGSVDNPMTEAELRAKFDENAGMLPPDQRRRLVDAIARTETLPDFAALVDLSIAATEAIDR